MLPKPFDQSVCPSRALSAKRLVTSWKYVLRVANTLPSPAATGFNGRAPPTFTCHLGEKVAGSSEIGR
jgi:hypothetical protein